MHDMHASAANAHVAARTTKDFSRTLTSPFCDRRNNGEKINGRTGGNAL
jgi:hypothetical protein